MQYRSYWDKRTEVADRTERVPIRRSKCRVVRNKISQLDAITRGWANPRREDRTGGSELRADSALRSNGPNERLHRFLGRVRNNFCWIDWWMQEEPRITNRNDLGFWFAENSGWSHTPITFCKTLIPAPLVSGLDLEGVYQSMNRPQRPLRLEFRVQSSDSTQLIIYDIGKRKKDIWFIEELEDKHFYLI